MPSPTCSTEPSSLSSVEPEKPSICVLMTAVISSGRIAIVMLVEALPQPAQLSAQAGIEDPVSDLDGDAADQFRVLFDLEFDVFSGENLKARGQRLLRVGRQRGGGAHVGLGDAALVGGQAGV